MKKLLYLLAALLLVSIIINIALLINVDDKIKVNKKDIQNIVIVNGQTGKAKEIKRKEDIETICDAINKTEMHIVKNPRYKTGGICYTFVINYPRYQIIITYRYGELLEYYGHSYRINSTKLEDFWNLKYKEENFRFPGIY